MVEFAVRVESHEGKLMTLRRGFVSQDAAEDYPVQLKLWKRVWVEPIDPRSITTTGAPKPLRAPFDHARELIAAFEMIEQAAIKGERCPQSGNFGPLRTSLARELARLGRIRIEISSLNWRQIVLLDGPHKGKATAPNPHKGTRVYQVIDASGRRINGRLADDVR